ncbi:MAG: hypothetical protein Q7U73_09130 [Rubrivivax sp.]|nr:hypothetical protein [Rubrivivax sp.]
MNTMHLLLPFTVLPLCRTRAARLGAGATAAIGVRFDGAPPGVPVCRSGHA